MIPLPKRIEGFLSAVSVLGHQSVPVFLAFFISFHREMLPHYHLHFHIRQTLSTRVSHNLKVTQLDTESHSACGDVDVAAVFPGR